jgi:hypothetical protein
MIAKFMLDFKVLEFFKDCELIFVAARAVVAGSTRQRQATGQLADRHVAPLTHTHLLTERALFPVSANRNRWRHDATHLAL